MLYLYRANANPPTMSDRRIEVTKPSWLIDAMPSYGVMALVLPLGMLPDGPAASPVALARHSGPGHCGAAAEVVGYGGAEAPPEEPAAGAGGALPPAGEEAPGDAGLPGFEPDPPDAGGDWLPEPPQDSPSQLSPGVENDPVGARLLPPEPPPGAGWFCGCGYFSILPCKRLQLLGLTCPSGICCTGFCGCPSGICCTGLPVGVGLGLAGAGTPPVASHPHGSVMVTGTGVESQTVHCLTVTVKPSGIWLGPGVQVGVASVQLSVTV